MNGFQDAFISYGRADSKHFALKLYQALSDRGLKIWFDFEDIPLGVDFQNQIDDGIEKADNFLFIIAPHSINSPYCLKEIELALKRNKRIIPLLHVEQIDRETWQARNPQGTDEQWQAYQAKGLHSSFPNMHPAIGKINWVYFRENLDDFDKSFAGLLNIFERHKAYVHEHTTLLANALEWEANQKQSRYLLVGDKRTAAETWLKIRFRDEQPPCIPSDLHCEYITESIKNANNLMTQVFLAYAHEDKAVMEKIRNSLQRESFTVWTNTTDIQTGETAEKAIKRGIEQADNVVYLLSPHTLHSEYCQQELDYALSLNKRIIPVLVKETDVQQIPQTLRDLQYIDLTDNVKTEDCRLDDNQLVKTLRQEEAYYNEHKQLLVKALKWHKQDQNPSILLRGYNLRSAEAWLKVAKQRQQHLPIAIQEQFITESLRQPPASSLDVFVSYSRADSDLARKLNDALQMQGKTTWFDQESIASGSDFQQEIYRGIEVSDNFLFILSPRSINSPYCADEVEYAAKLNKRFVTVLHQPVNPTEVHPELAKIQWIDFHKNEGDFANTFSQLIRTLDTDRDHVHSHTKWSQIALEWQAKDKNPDLLLRGSEFAVARAWLKTALEQTKSPAPTALQQEFLKASEDAIVAAEETEKQRQAELLRLQAEKIKEAEARLAEQKKSAKRQKLFLSAMSVGFIISTFLAGIAFLSYRKAIASENAARAAYAKALAKSSEAFFASGKPLEALVEALRANQGLEAIRDPSRRPEIRENVAIALQKAVFGIREHNRLTGHAAAAIAVAYSPNGQLIASGSEDNTVKIWRHDGQLLATLEHPDSILDVAFSPDGQLVASAGVDDTVKLWQTDGTFLASFEGHGADINSVAFSPDGQLIASASNDRTIKLWRKDGTLVKTLTNHANSVESIAFSPDGQLLLSASSDKTLKLWQLDGKVINTLTGHTDEVNDAVFSPDGQLIASASDDKTIKLWQLDGKLVKTLVGHDDLVRSVAFSPQGDVLASASWDQTVKLWTLEGTVLESYSGYTNRIYDVAFSPDGQLIASANQNTVVTLWQRQQRFLHILSEHQRAVNQVTFSADGQLLASASDDKTLKLYQQDPMSKRWKFRNTLPHADKVHATAFSPDDSLLATGGRDRMLRLWQPQDGTLLKTIDTKFKIRDIAFSPDSQLIATAYLDNDLQIWERSGRLLATLKAHQDNVTHVVFSPDGQYLASSSADNTVRLWSRHGKLLATLTAHKGPITSVSFSPDGKTLATTSADFEVKLWKVEASKLLPQVTFSEHDDLVTDVVFSPDNRLIASAGADNTIKLWKADGTLLHSLYGHQNMINSLAFHPTEPILASTSNDHKVILWHLQEIQKSDMERVEQDGCTWLRDFLATNATLTDRDRQLCNDVVTTAQN
jgi:WD40 repeat protein